MIIQALELNFISTDFTQINWIKAKRQLRCREHKVGTEPERIQVDNGSEFISKILDKWAYDNKVTLDFSKPGKPTDNAYMNPSTGAFGMNARM